MKMIAVVVAALCGLSCGCNRKHSDLSTPTAAVKVYGQAMREGDAATARRAVTNVDPKVIDALAALGASRRRAMEAAVAKFGDDGKTVAGGSALPYGEEFDKMLDEADVKIDGDTATVTQKAKDAVPIALKREGGDWKIDYSDLTKRGDLIQMLPVMGAIAVANDELADEIKAGKYASVAEAKKARAFKMQQALMPRGKDLYPSTQAASQPR
jgi:hypothetical protein